MLKIKQCFLKEKNTEIKKENQDHIMYFGYMFKAAIHM